MKSKLKMREEEAKEQLRIKEWGERWNLHQRTRKRLSAQELIDGI